MGQVEGEEGKDGKSMEERGRRMGRNMQEQRCGLLFQISA